MFGLENVASLVGVVPNDVIIQLTPIIDVYKINTDLRVAHFLAQCAHESMGFRATEENLNYSKEALLKVFSKYFKTEEEAQEYARQPEKIANKVYANRMKNGNEESGDGWKYRGRGYIQLTGKENYMALNKLTPENILEEPDLVATKYPLRSASWFWDSRSLNQLADTGATDEVVKQITRKVNGGYNGLADRQREFKKIYEALSSS